MAKTMITRSCDYCGKHYVTGRQDSKYCSASCKTQAYNVRMGSGGPVTRREIIKDIIKPASPANATITKSLFSEQTKLVIPEAEYNGRGVCPGCGTTNPNSHERGCGYCNW